MQNVSKLKSLCAAYQAALEYDYCPPSKVAEGLVDEIMTDFSAEDFRLGAKEKEGCRPDEIADSIIRLVQKM